MRRPTQRPARSALAATLAGSALAIAAMPAHAADGALAYRKVALLGEAAPGTEPGTTFSTLTTPLNHGIMVPRIDDDGRVAFIALVDGAAVDETNRSGIWAEKSGALSLVARTGMRAPGTPEGVVFLGLPSEYLPFPPDFSGGNTAFQGVLTGPGIDSSNDDGLWVDGPQGLVLVGREQDPAPDMGAGIRFTSLGGTVDPAGRARLTATLGGTGVDTTNNDSIWSDRTGALASILREGDPAPGMGAGVVFGSGNTGAAYTFRSIAFNDASSLAVQANLLGPGVDAYNDECVFVERGGQLALVVRDGDDAPGVENPGPGPATGTFGGGSVSAGFSTLSHNDAGHVAFSVRVGGDNWNVDVIYSDRTGSLWPEVRAGDPAPGTGQSFTIVGSPVLSDADRIAFSASVETGLWPPTGIFWDQPGALAPLVLPGQEIAEMTVTGTSGIVGFNAAGELAFRVGLEHPVEGFKSGLALADPSGAARIVAATGDLFDVEGDGSDLREIVRIQPGGLSESGSVAFRLDFTDGTSGHFAASLPRAGVASGLRVARSGADLELSWDADCAGSGHYGVYRGRLDAGLASLAAEPGLCDVTTTSATVSAGADRGEFFLVVPNTGASEGGYGPNSEGEPRAPAGDACLPQGTIAVCGP